MFSNCSSLKEVVLPKSIWRIGIFAFFGCSSLTEIHLPEGVELLAAYSFRECDNLKAIILPKSVRTIQDSVPGGGMPELDPFDRDNEELVLYVTENSYAHKYAKKEGLKYSIR